MITVRGCATCHFAQRVEDSGDNVKLYCGVGVDRPILPQSMPEGTSPRDAWKFYPNANGHNGVTIEDAYSSAPEWCPLRQGPISIALEE